MSRVRYLELGDLSARVEVRDQDTILLSARAELEPYPTTIVDRLRHWASASPEATFIARRARDDKDRWQKLSYAQTWESTRRIASALERYSLSVDRPIAILSGNSIEHALLGLAGMYLGVPYAPVSPQYSLLSTAFGKLRHVLDLITPGMVFVDDAEVYQKAIAATVSKDVVIVCVKGDIPGYTCVRFDELLAAPIDEALELARARIGGDDIAKFLFSSGSTGMPKAVINTHRMLSANLQMISQAYPFLKDAPVLVDWLPWNHTFGGNHNVGIALYNGGSLYIDDGKPVPGAFLETVRNLKEIAPTAYFNVPKGFEMLVKYLREDSDLREMFFSKVKMFFYAGAGISQPVWDALEETALATCGERVIILTGLGCTETAPSALFTTTDRGFAGLIGLPIPGVEAKLAKVGGKWEICFRGDNVTPGYWRDPELTAKAFDSEGYYRTGDAVKFVDAEDPQKGLQFDGRISEDFKLDTGTWVSAGPLRAKFLDHFGTLVKDVVIVGRDRASVGALVFPDLDHCRSALPSASSATSLNAEEILQHEHTRNTFQQLLNSFAASASGSASRVDRILLQSNPPVPDKNEITDKGSLNASAIQDNRKDQLDAMYRQPASPLTICIDK